MLLTRLIEMGKPAPRAVRKIILSTAIVLATGGAHAADPTTFSVQGTVTDRTGNPVEGAAIVLDGSTLTATDSNGSFSIDLEPGEVVILATHPAYRPLRHELTVDRDLADIRLELSPPMSVSESITVTAIRAGEDAPVTKTNLDRQQIEELSYGQDVPQVLQYTPSLTWYSDSGIGSNYSYFSLRGIQQTRINMTFDGAPLNDPAEHALYFNNFHDFTSAVDSIQVQRGVGTSTVGSPSFGGSVNFASNPLSQSPQGDVRLALGSYDTLRASAAYESGVFGNGFAVSGRVSYARTDGYRDSSGTEHHTFFLNGEWQGERSTLKFVSFFGDEKTQLAWLAVDPDTLAVNPRFNELTEDDRDNFGQDFTQLQYTRAISNDALLVASVYYNGADGWYRLWGEDYGINQHFIGGMVRLSKTTDRLNVTGGIHYNDFEGDHTLDIEDERIYKNTGFKKTANAFAKAEYRLGSWLLFGDLHLRWAEFSYEGEIDLGSVDWTFIDPRIGARRVLSDRLSVYASIGKAEREPARLDMLAGEDNATEYYDLTAVKPEEVVDLEIGVNYNTPRLALQAGLYAMDFDNEIALTGELSAVGYPIRRNVDDSFRRGVELDLRWLVGRNWAIINNSTLSHNRISTWTQYVEVFDSDWNWIGSEPITYDDVPPLLTPELIVNQGVEWFPGDSKVSLVGRFIDSSHLDNTGTDELRAPSYFNLDLRASHTFSRWGSIGRPTVTLFINNLLDAVDQYPSGYSWQYIMRDTGGNDTLSGIPYYYPLATRNFVVTLDFKL